jgi:hypothetical protein
MGEEKEYVVRVHREFEYRTKAENADDAARRFENGEAGEGRCVGYSVESVVSAELADKLPWESGDERLRCVCGHLFWDEHTGFAFRRPFILRGEKPVGENPNPTSCDRYMCECLSRIDSRWLGEDGPEDENGN